MSDDTDIDDEPTIDDTDSAPHEPCMLCLEDELAAHADALLDLNARLERIERRFAIHGEGN